MTEAVKPFLEELVQIIGELLQDEDIRKVLPKPAWYALRIGYAILKVVVRVLEKEG